MVIIMKEKSEFALRLKKLRKLHGETAQEVADAIEIKSATYRRYEIDTQPRFEIISAIANHFGVSVDYLIRGDESEAAQVMPEDISGTDIYHVRNEIVTLTAEEALLVKQCRKLSQEDFCEVMRYIAWRKSETDRNKKPRSLRNANSQAGVSGKKG